MSCWWNIVRFQWKKKKRRDTFHCFAFLFKSSSSSSKPETKTVWEELTQSHSSPSLAVTARRRRHFAQFNVLFCGGKKEKKTGRRLVNFNFWFQKLSNTAQMRNQFSQLPRLCGAANCCYWWAAGHMTKSGISPAGPCCRHLNYRLPLVICLHNISFSKHDSYLIHDNSRHSNCNMMWKYLIKFQMQLLFNYYFLLCVMNSFTVLLICSEFSNKKNIYIKKTEIV